MSDDQPRITTEEVLRAAPSLGVRLVACHNMMLDFDAGDTSLQPTACYGCPLTLLWLDDCVLDSEYERHTWVLEHLHSLLQASPLDPVFDDEDPSAMFDTVIENWADEKYGRDYRLGIQYGFDGRGLVSGDEFVAAEPYSRTCDYARYRQGYEDGARLFRELSQRPEFWLTTPSNHATPPETPATNEQEE